VSAKQIAAAIAAVLAVIVIGSYVYWRGEGSPGTSEQFRDRVAEAGLEVDWDNNGPRGGDGSVDTDCGVVDITISELDGELWFVEPEGNRRVTVESIDRLLACD
jgi:hypothetical protein